MARLWAADLSPSSSVSSFLNANVKEILKLYKNIVVQKRCTDV